MDEYLKIFAKTHSSAEIKRFITVMNSLQPKSKVGNSEMAETFKLEVISELKIILEKRKKK